MVVTKTYRKKNGRGWLLTRKEGIGEGNHDDKKSEPGRKT